MKVVSMKGVAVDMSRYITQNETAVAVGNGKMNARGDILGRGGKVVTERDQVAQEYHQKHGPNTVKHVPLSNLQAEVLTNSANPFVTADDMDFQDPAAAAAELDKVSPRRRRTKPDADE
jgi:hypothetical protein